MPAPKKTKTVAKEKAVKKPSPSSKQPKDKPPVKEAAPPFNPMAYLKDNLHVIPHALAIERWHEFMSFKPFNEYVRSIGIPIPPLDVNSCKLIGTMLICFKSFFSSSQQLFLFDLLNEGCRPMLSSWDVNSITARELVSDPEDIHRFYRLMGAWGYGIWQCPNSDPVPQEILNILKELGVIK